MPTTITGAYADGTHATETRAAIQNALDAAGAVSTATGQLGQTVCLSHGYYAIGSSGLSIPAGVALVGDGSGSCETLNQGRTILYYTGTGSAVTLAGNKSEVRELTVSCAESSAIGIHSYDATSRLHTDIVKCSVEGSCLIGIKVENTLFCTVDRCIASGMAGGYATGLVVVGSNEVHALRCNFRQHADGCGVTVDDGNAVNVFQCNLEGTGIGVNVGDSSPAQVRVVASRFEGCGVGIYIAASQNQVMASGNFYGADTVVGILDESSDHISDVNEPHIANAITPVSGSLSVRHMRAPAGSPAAGSLVVLGSDGCSATVASAGLGYSASHASTGGPTVTMGSSPVLARCSGTDYVSWPGMATYLSGTSIHLQAVGSFNGSADAIYADASTVQVSRSSFIGYTASTGGAIARGAERFRYDSTGWSVMGHATAAQQTVTGSRSDGTALASLLAILESHGVVVDGSAA